jgi:hypothetical protein
MLPFKIVILYDTSFNQLRRSINRIPWYFGGVKLFKCQEAASLDLILTEITFTNLRTKECFFLMELEINFLSAYRF